MILSRATIDRILDAAYAGDADFAEVFCEEDRQLVLRAKVSGTDGISAGLVSGVGIRVLSGDTCRYAYADGGNEETLLKLARQLASPGAPAVPRRPLGTPISYGAQYLPEPDRMKAALTGARRAVDAGMAFSGEVTQVVARLVNSERQILVANTEGLLAEDCRRKTRLQISAYAGFGGQLQYGYSGPGAMGGLDYLEGLDIEAHARHAAEAAVTAVHAGPCPGGTMTVVVGNGFGGLMFHEACGHSLEASSVAKGNSEFSGKLGQQVASPLVTLIDDGTVPGQWGSMGMDDEGTPAQRNVLIEKGILKCYMADRFGGRLMGAASTGSGRRQNYRFPPEARMTNTFIAAGESTPEEIIAATERGLYVGNIFGGSVNPLTGDFNFNVLECRLIENGRLGAPVRGTTLIGSGGEILSRVDMVGNDLSLGQGYCYNNSGALFIGAGQPTVRVNNILVGGER